MALLLITRADIKRRWASLLLIGLLAGLAGGTVAGALGVARRTDTADRRLSAATAADDARALVVGGSRVGTEAIGGEVLSLPQVERGRLALGGVARLDAPGVVYLSVIAGPDDWGGDVLSPVVSAGRLPEPGRADEVVVNEQVLGSALVPVGLGQKLRLHLLTADEFASFDAGAPLLGRGGTQEVTVVGLVRLPGAPQELPPLIGTRALVDAHPNGIGILGAALVQLRPDADLDAFRDAANRAGVDVTRPPTLSGFPPVTVNATAVQSNATTRTTTHVLSLGLVVLAAVAALVGAAATIQAAVRHHAGTVEDQQIEAAIGLARAARARARLLAALPSAVLASALTLGAGLVAARLPPPGALRLVEPHPGFAPNVSLLAAVTAVTVGLLLVSMWLTALRATTRLDRMRRRSRRDPGPVDRATRWAPSPVTSLGFGFAFDRSAGEGRAGTRATIGTLAVGLTGLVAVLVFVASLDRLVHTPRRYGAPNDIVVQDAGPDLARSFASDARFDSVVSGSSANLIVDGRSVSGTSRVALVGPLGWELEAGRPPASDTEIVLGTRLARELDKHIGDVVDLLDRDGTHHRLTVVGVGVVPDYNTDSVGQSAGLTVGGLEAVASASSFGELGLSVRDDAQLETITNELQARYELDLASDRPRDVANLEQIDRVPVLLAIFMAALCLASLAHAVDTTIRRRRGDLATARALGFTAGQTSASVIVMVLTVTAVALVVAVPFGILIGTTVWRLVAEGAAVLGDADYRWPALAAVAPVTAAVAVGLAALPARRAGRRTLLPARRGS